MSFFPIIFYFIPEYFISIPLKPVCFLMRKRKVMNLGRNGGRHDLGEIERRIQKSVNII